MIAWLLAIAAWASPQPVVTMGDGLVVGERAQPAAVSSEAPAEPVGWVAVLADCLEERAPGQFALVDRSTDDPSLEAMHEQVAGIREVDPALVVVGLGAAAPGSDGPEALGGLVDALRAEPAPEVMLVGPVAPAVAPPDVEAQQARDRRTTRWNGALASAAEERPGVHHVDLLAGWPSRPDERRPLTAAGGHLSDQGHARVAAALCDAVLAWRPTDPER